MNVKNANFDRVNTILRITNNVVGAAYIGFLGYAYWLLRDVDKG